MLPIVHHLLREQQQEVNLNLRRRRRQCRETFDLNNMNDNRFIELFRFSKAAFLELCGLLRPHMHQPSHADKVSVEQKILVALRFYATGSYQRCVGGDFNLAVSQTSAHRYIHEVTNAINNHLSQRYIQFPTTRREINRNKEMFMEKFHFPGVLGAIDGTHIAILKPVVDEHNFICRKGFHSLNALVVCDAELKFSYVNANYPGSNHDSFIWRQSQLRQLMLEKYNRNDMRGTWLIADSGFPLEPFIMTPHLNPGENTPEARYNHAHNIARNTVERAIGLLKCRFRCLLRERVARYAPNFVGNLINACATLHNILIDFGIEYANIDLGQEENDNPQIHLGNPNPGDLLFAGRAVRNQICQNYFQE